MRKKRTNFQNFKPNKTKVINWTNLKLKIKTHNQKITHTANVRMVIKHTEETGREFCIHRIQFEWQNKSYVYSASEQRVEGGWRCIVLIYTCLMMGWLVRNINETWNKSGSTKWTYLYRTMSIGWCEIAKRCTTLLNIGPCSNTSLSVCLCFCFCFIERKGRSFVRYLMHKQINSRYLYLNLNFVFFICFVCFWVSCNRTCKKKKQFIRCCIFPMHKMDIRRCQCLC